MLFNSCGSDSKFEKYIKVLDSNGDTLVFFNNIDAGIMEWVAAEKSNITVPSENYSEWSLPTIDELQILYNIKNSLSGLQCQFYNDNYWSSTPDGSNYKSVQFDGGAVSSWSASNNFRVWAVHAF